MQVKNWNKFKEIARRTEILPGIVVLSLIIIARLTGSLQFLEWLVFDSFLRLRPAESIDERVVIVGINEADLRRVNAYPVPDRELALLIKKLQAYKPRVIGLDIFRNLAVPPGHTELVATFKNSKNLIAIEKVLPEPITPPRELASEKIGFADAIFDADDRLRRSLLGTPTPQAPEIYKFSLSLRLAENYLAAQGITLENGIRDRKTMRFAQTELPRFQPSTGGYVSEDAGGLQVLLNFRSGQRRFRTFSFYQILAGVDPNLLRDRIVIIGITSPSAKDIINTNAIPGREPIYGVEIQAHAVSQILSAVLDGRPLLKAWADVWEYLWIISWGLLGIAFGLLIKFPLRNLLIVIIASAGLLVISYLLLVFGWWIPVVPAMLVLLAHGIGLNAFYQYNRTLKERIADRQLVIERTYDKLHNGPLQTLKVNILKRLHEQDFSQNKLVAELEKLDQELRAIYKSLDDEIIAQKPFISLGSGEKINLQDPLDGILYQVYSSTLQRDFPYFKTIKHNIHNFNPVDDCHLNVEQKRGICQFLEEALCNVGKHAQGVTQLTITYTKKKDQYILKITDDGQGISSPTKGGGTQQAEKLKKQLPKGKFNRSPHFPRGTSCELNWSAPKFWFRKKKQ